jgi:hypothetical protein
MTGAPSEAAAWEVRPGTPVPIRPSHHGHCLECWPLRNSLLLGALAGAVPSARAHVQQLLWEWSRNELGHDVGLVALELVGNSVKASGAFRPTVARIQVWLGSDPHHVLVAVTDASPQRPVRLNPGPDTERGRGLALVEAFSNRWGWYPVRATGAAKVVWAEWLTSSATHPGASADPRRMGVRG